MKPFLVTVLVLLLVTTARAHDIPRSHVALRIGDTGVAATLEAPALGFTHYAPATEEQLLTPNGATAQKATLAASLVDALTITADGQPLAADLQSVEPVAGRKDLRLRFRFAAAAPRSITLRCRLFPFSPSHKMFVDIYDADGTLARQAILDADASELGYTVGERQSTASVIRQFVAEGVRHIFIGPDHILFIIGLLLLGGSLKRLLKIVTAFTLAHSITLVLAALDIVALPSRVVEPTIALSIVFVGIHSLTKGADKRDLRLVLAFCFGLIHGFGFASVLRELELPRYALGWSLLSFNIGVEAGQACIVLAVAPLLALLRKRSPTASRRVVFAGSLAVILAGAYWFGERLAS